MRDERLSLTEYAVLGVLGEGATHGFAVARELDHEGDLGRVFSVRRPLVYRALDRLVDVGYAKQVATEPGDAGPRRVVHETTADGRRALGQWLATPVEHVRDIRIEFLLKLSLLRRAGRSVSRLIRAQRLALAPTLAALEQSESPSDDDVELWRRHNARATDAYLKDLEIRHLGA